MNRQSHSRLAALMAASAGHALILAASPQAFAQQSGDDSTSEADDVVVITGIRQTLDDALIQRRNADVILDGISAGDLGEFPDLNLGEALQRIPGIQIDREAERRSSSISVRGLPGSFSITTVMGQTISPATRAGAAGAATGNNPFGIFDSSVFNGANVIKSFSAENQSGGLAAIVDLRITPALDRTDGQFVARADVGYEETAQAFTPGGFVSGAKHFANDRVGVFGSLAYSKQRFRRDSFSISNYTAFDSELFPFTELDPDPSVDDDYTVVFPGNLRQFTEESEGTRLSIATGAEWRPNDQLSLRVDGLFAQRDLAENTLDVVQIQPRQSTDQVVPLVDPVFAGNVEVGGTFQDYYYVPEIAFEDPRFGFGNRDFPFFEETYGIYPQVTWENDNWTVNAIGTISESENTFIQNQFAADVWQTGDGGTNGITGVYNTGSGDVGNYLLSLDIPAGAFDAERGEWTLLNNTIQANNGTEPVENRFTIGANAQRTLRELRSFEGSIDRRLGFGPLESVKVGARFEDEETDNLWQENSAIGAQLNNLTNDIVVLNSALTSGGVFFGGQAPGYLVDGFWSLDRDLIRQQILPLDPSQAEDGDVLNELTGFYQRRPASRQFARNFTAEKETVETFAMARFDFAEKYNLPVRGNVGARYVDTSLSGRLDSAAADEEDATGEYSSWLPSVNVIADLRDNIIANFAYYETFETPNLAEFSPAPTVITVNEPVDDGVGSVTIDVSTLDLEPRSSEAFDVGLAWYNRQASIIGINLFRKSVLANIVREPTCPTEGAFGFGPLFLDSSLNCRIDDGAALEEGNRRITINRFVNVDEPIIVKGIEFQIAQNLSFMDSWVRGFGGVFNYTHVTSDSDSGEELTRVSDNTYNIIGFYETDTWSVRLAQNYRSDYLLPAGSSFSGSAREVKGRTQLDLSTHYEPIDGLTFRFEAFNLTNALREEFEFDEGVVRRADYDGRTYQFSIQKQF